jgi:hypothetical protein
LPGTDFIENFGSEGFDKLDLSDLLVDVRNNGTSDGIGDLEQYLHVSTAENGVDTVVSISTGGGFAYGGYDASAVDQTITLLGVDLGTDSIAAIQDLLSNNQLITD